MWGAAREGQETSEPRDEPVAEPQAAYELAHRAARSLANGCAAINTVEAEVNKARMSIAASRFTSRNSLTSRIPAELGRVCCSSVIMAAN